MQGSGLGGRGERWYLVWGCADVVDGFCWGFHLYSLIFSCWVSFGVAGFVLASRTSVTGREIWCDTSGLLRRLLWNEVC